MALPDIPSIQTLEERIISDIEGKINQTIPANKISFVRTLASAIAGTFFLLYLGIEWVYKQIFIQSADYESLLKWGEIVDVIIKKAETATITADVPGPGSSVVIGTEFRGESNQVVYRVTVTTAITAGVALDVPMKALESGIIGNLDNGDTLDVVGSVPAVDGTATVTGLPVSGSELEEREIYRDRTGARYKTKFTIGSVAGYVQLGLETPNFTWIGPFADPDLASNTIVYGRVSLSLNTDGIATGDQLNELYLSVTIDPDTGLQDRRLLGETIETRAVANRQFDITISINAGTPTVKDDIENAVAEYLQSFTPYIEGAGFIRNDTMTNGGVSAVANSIANLAGAQVTAVFIIDVITSNVEQIYTFYGNEFAISRNISFVDVT